MKRPLALHGAKIQPKSPRPRRNIWLSRSQSDIFARKAARKVNVHDPYYEPPPSPSSPDSSPALPSLSASTAESLDAMVSLFTWLVLEERMLQEGEGQKVRSTKWRELHFMKVLFISTGQESQLKCLIHLSLCYLYITHTRLPLSTGRSAGGLGQQGAPTVHSEEG